MPVAAIKTCNYAHEIIMVIALYIDEDIQPWKERIAALRPDLEVRAWPEWGALSEIQYALVWGPPNDLLSQCENLRAVVSLGAGVDHLLPAIAGLPTEIPIVRMADQALVDGMTEFIVMNVLLHHRQTLDYLMQQRDRLWRALPPVLAQERRVGFMGFGNMAKPAADSLRAMGFAIQVWSRSPKNLEGMDSYVGTRELAEFLEKTDILVMVLPSTPATDGILNAETIAQLPQGAAIINVGRGQAIVESALLDALHTGQVSAASLDVFGEEPLASDSVLWGHPQIVISPHVASPTIVKSAAAYVVSIVDDLEAGRPLEAQLDRSRSY